MEYSGTPFFMPIRDFCLPLMLSHTGFFAKTMQKCMQCSLPHTHTRTRECAHERYQMREGECFAALDFFAFVTSFVTLDLQSSVIFICGFVIRIRQRFGLQIRFVNYAGLQIMSGRKI